MSSNWKEVIPPASGRDIRQLARDFIRTYAEDYGNLNQGFNRASAWLADRAKDSKWLAELHNGAPGTAYHEFQFNRYSRAYRRTIELAIRWHSMSRP